MRCRAHPGKRLRGHSAIKKGVDSIEAEDRGRFLQADDRKVTRTAASIAVAAEHCLNMQAGEFAEQQADRRRSGGKEPTCLR